MSEFDGLAGVRPNLFIIGAPKCGTTAVAQWLADREDVFFSNPKEPFFLCDDFPNMAGEITLVDTPEKYLRLFAGADPAKHKVIAEGSTAYLRSTRAVARALELNPEARFIVMLRDPVEVAQAFHMEQLFARNEDQEDFETAWRLQDERAQGRSLSPHAKAPEFLQYHDTAAFGPQLDRLVALVPEERRLVVLQQDLRDDARALWLKVQAFLGLEDDGRTEFPKVNASRKHRVQWLADLWLDPPRPLRPGVLAVRRMLNEHRPPAIEALKKALRKPHDRPTLSPAFEAELRALFAPDVARVEAVLGRPTGWPRPEVPAAPLPSAAPDLGQADLGQAGAVRS
ncbi:hypothetical protein P2H44_25380 [Albimonas sp. CAU 1670]|uniref:hypothetical protein n=1 Tax=Albimonas sp. CAU 1670 TaxID=3032599 RepID=UPI0023DADDE1|nr:hypothetical protein [Albimonas sp. CAU 1670]MDF2235897.1 hypothetical protein [Albimonas sp. CAU 1670]